MKTRYFILAMLLCSCGTLWAQWLNNGTHIYNSNAGNVGIGIMNPDHLLTLTKTHNPATTENVFKVNFDSNWGLRLIQNYTGLGDIRYEWKQIYNSVTYDVLAFKAGKVGIGNTNPDHLLTLTKTHNEATTENVFKVNYDSNWGLRLIQNYTVPGDIRYEWKQIYSSVTYDVLAFKAGNVGIGTTTPDAKLAVKGDIHTQEVRVDLNGAVAPDFVFEPTYNLRTLAETERYIKEHKHLPEIPSAAEMEANGMELKAMNLKLLQKVEELTLYTIEQQKLIEKLTNRIEKLETTKN